MIERYSFHERICHWTTAAAYLYCLATGLAFYTPHLFWLAVILGGGPTSRQWHPLLGVVFVAAVIWMHALWSKDVAIGPSDKEWLAKSEAYVTNDDAHVPPQERFNGGQKVFYWAMFWGALALFCSGALMWFPEYVPAGLRWIRPVAILVHECAALVTIGAFIVHIYMGVFVVPGSTEAMVGGRVTKRWAMTHHKLWYDRILRANK